MRGVQLFVIGGLLAAGGVYATLALQQQPAEVDMSIKTASVSDGTAFRLAARGSGGDCRMVVQDAARQGGRALSLDRDCGNVAPDLSQASVWSPDGEGGAAIADAQGHVLVRFVPGDGIAYVSQDNGAPKFTLETE